VLKIGEKEEVRNSLEDILMSSVFAIKIELN